MVKLLKKKQFWGALIAVAFLALSFKDFSISDLGEIWDRASLAYLIPVLALSFVMQSSRALRWRTIVQPSHYMKVSRAVPLYATGAALNYIMPALTGQVGRMLLFAKKEKLPKAMLFSTFLVETIFDALMLFGLIFLGSLGPLYPEEFSAVSDIVFITAVSMLGLLYLFLAFRGRIENVNRKRLRERWPGVYITIRKFTLSFSRGVDALRSSKHFMRSLGFSIVVWGSHIVAVYLLFRAYGLEIPPAAAIVIVVINTLAMLIPITPGNAGTFEFVVIATLSGFGVAKTDAALFAITLHLIDIMPILVLSLPVLRSKKISLAEMEEDEAAAEREMVAIVDDPKFVMEAEGK